jgi:hypothetical protein
MMFSSLSPKTRKMVALPLATALVVGTFFFFQKSSSRTESVAPTGAVSPSAVESAPAATEAAAVKNQTNPTAPSPSRPAVPSGPVGSTISTKNSCWSAEFKIDGELKAAQKANFGERDQVIGLAPLARIYPQWSNSRLCVRSQGKAVAFDRDPSSEERIRIRGGSGRIRPDSHIEVSYCSSSASECAPCAVSKDDFENNLFGESADVASENEDADVTTQLSPEVRRELARLDRDSAPAPISSWTMIQTGSSCGKTELRVAKAGGTR